MKEKELIGKEIEKRKQKANQQELEPIPKGVYSMVAL